MDQPQPNLASELRTALGAKPRIQRWAPYIAAAASEHAAAAHMDPLELALLVAAVMDRESQGNNIKGDAGHGHGLMQIDDRSHGPWLAANSDGMDPESNIMKGTEILCANIALTSRNVHPEDNPTRVAIAAYNCGLGRALKSAAEGDPDQHTTLGPPDEKGIRHPDYSADVLRRRDEFRARLVAP